MPFMLKARPKNLLIRLSLLHELPQYRRLLAARALSLLGIGFLLVAVPIQVYAMTGSTLWVAVAGAGDAAGLFLGLMVGGVLADSHDLRKLILLARSICGLGFAALAVNAIVTTPSLVVVLGLAFVDGLFGAIGVSALMALVPRVVGRARIVEAGALGMLVTRIVNIASPALAGVLLALTDVVWAYVIAAVTTAGTVVILRGLTPMPPVPAAPVPAAEPDERNTPFAMLAQAIALLVTRRQILIAFLLGTLLTVCTGIRVLFPALAQDVFGAGDTAVGLLFAMGPIGAALAALLSGWAYDHKAPFRLMTLLCCGALAAFAAIGLSPALAGVMLLLVVFGYLMSTASLLQYGLVQRQTPDAFLGRINSLWLAQDALGDILGALAMGLLASRILPLQAVLMLGLTSLAAVILGAIAAVALGKRPGQQPADPA